MNKIRHYAGTNYEIGMAIGRQIGERYPERAEKYIAAMDYQYGINHSKLEQECMLWFNTLPEQYQEELTGISDGAVYPLEKIAQFNYADRCIAGGCTSFICIADGDAWIGRNNDYLSLDSWGYVNFFAVNRKIPVILFGMEGDNFSGTGINKEKLWLHYNWLPVWDNTTFDEKPLSPFVFLRLALETCSSVGEVEYLIKSTIRDSGMGLYAVDGKTNEFTVFECTCREYARRECSGTFISGANHYEAVTPPSWTNYDFTGSRTRQAVVNEILLQGKFGKLPDAFASILSNPRVEQNNGLSGTVYANVCCPAREEIWYAHDGFPAASKGTWDKIDWDW